MWSGPGMSAAVLNIPPLLLALNGQIAQISAADALWMWMEAVRKTPCSWLSVLSVCGLTDQLSAVSVLTGRLCVRTELRSDQDLLCCTTDAGSYRPAAACCSRWWPLDVAAAAPLYRWGVQVPPVNSLIPPFVIQHNIRAAQSKQRNAEAKKTG